MRADHAAVLKQLKTARGQIEGIIKMVEDDRYCIDISNQVLAARALLGRVNSEIIKAHMEGCIMDAAVSGTEEDRRAKVEEVAELLKKLMK